MPIALLASAALSACGSSTKTVSVSEAPPATRGTSAATGATGSSGPTGTSATPSTGSETGTSSGGTPAGATHTASEPAFTHAESQGEALSQAVGVLHERGYDAVDTAEYHPSQTLRVLIGSKGTGAYAQQAFFFIGDHYLGTDTKEPSAAIGVVQQGDTEVTLAYTLYRTAGGTTTPSGTHATVRFELDDGQLAALDPVPPASSSSSDSRL